jgi:hypothetical protein
MAECPWCHGPVPDVGAPCPNCGKVASDLRTTDPPEPLVRKNVDVPDLVIPAAPAPKPVAKPVVSARPAPLPSSLEDDFAAGGGGDLQIDLSGAVKPGIARPPTPGAGFNPFDDDMSAGPSLELDVQGGGLPPRISSPSLPIARPAAPPPPISHRSLAADGVAPARSTHTDPFEAKALADYGPPPDAFWRAPFYAYRVVTRRAELRRAHARTKEEADHILKRVEDALVALGERARSLAKDGATTLTESMLERVRAAEDLLRNRDGALAGARDGHEASLREIDARLATGEAELGQATEAEGRAKAAHDAAEAAAQRADAKLKRVDIELRAQGSAPTLQAHTPEHEAAAAELAKCTQQRGAAEQALAEARHTVAAARARVTTVAAERTAQDERFARQANARGAGVDDAQSQLRSALAELGRGLLADASHAGAATEALTRARDEVARLEEQAEAKTKSVAMHESAITSYDPGKVVLGIALVVTALVLLVVLVFFPFIYRAFAS